MYGFHFMYINKEKNTYNIGESFGKYRQNAGIASNDYWRREENINGYFHGGYGTMGRHKTCSKNTSLEIIRNGSTSSLLAEEISQNHKRYL